MRRRMVLYGPLRADIYCTLEEQPDGCWTVTYTEPHTVPLGRVPTQAEAEALARQWACERSTPGKWSEVDLDAQHAAWVDTLALIEIHAGARCEVLADPGSQPFLGRCADKTRHVDSYARNAVRFWRVARALSPVPGLRPERAEPLMRG